MKCPECGKLNNSNFKFCQFCGHSLTQPLDSDSIEIPSSVLSSPDSFDDWFVNGDDPHPSLFENAIEGDEKSPFHDILNENRTLRSTTDELVPLRKKAEEKEAYQSTSKGKTSRQGSKSSTQNPKVQLSPKLAISKLNARPNTQLDPEKPKITEPVTNSVEKKLVSKPKIVGSVKSDKLSAPKETVKIEDQTTNLKKSSDANKAIRTKATKKEEPKANLKKSSDANKAVSAKKEVRKLNLKDSSDANHVISLNERPMPKTEPRTCPNCKEKIIEGHKFCGKCGQPIASAPAASNKNIDVLRNEEKMEDVNDRVMMSTMNLLNAPHDSMTFGQMHDVPGVVPKPSRYSFCHIRDDGSEGETLPLFMGENIIGKNTSDAFRSDQFVSPKHARIVCHENKAVIEDFNSLNGVFFRISNESVILYDGDIFRIGEELLLYTHGDSDQPILSNPRGEDSVLIGGAETQGWGYLRTILGPFSEGNVYRLWQPTVTLGRTRANIIFPRDCFVSGMHASLKVQKNFAILTDLNSSNGTFVRLKDNMEITDCAHILIGNQLIRISRK